MDIFQDAQSLLSIPTQASFQEISQTIQKGQSHEEKSNLIPKPMTGVSLEGEVASILDLLQRAMALDEANLLTRSIYKIIFDNTKDQLPKELLQIESKDSSLSCYIL